jgi:hypothetical protein
MGKKYYQGFFTPKNVNKYIGKTKPMARSSWELRLMIFFDETPNILCWSSEPMFIPYFNPVKNKMSKYYPDFLVKVLEKDGKIKVKMIEVKPSKETCMEAAKSKKDKIAVIVNQAKWEAARKFCELNNMIFEILTELHLYHK